MHDFLESCGRALRGFLAYVIRSLVYPRPCEDLLPYLRFAWPLSLGNKVNQPVFRYDPPYTPHTHTHTTRYTMPYHTHLHAYAHAYTYIDALTRASSLISLVWKGNRADNEYKGPWYIEAGQKRALVEPPENGRLLSSLVNNSFDIVGKAWMIGRLMGGKENYWKIDFCHSNPFSFDQGPKHRCVTHLVRASAPRTFGWAALREPVYLYTCIYIHMWMYMYICIWFVKPKELNPMVASKNGRKSREEGKVIKKNKETKGTKIDALAVCRDTRPISNFALMRKTPTNRCR